MEYPKTSEEEIAPYCVEGKANTEDIHWYICINVFTRIII